ncbi:MAG: hypothetical protein ABIL58_19955 [Pseudomonadota bacterium]
MKNEIQLIISAVNKTGRAWGQAMKSVDDFKLKVSGLEQQLQSLASVAVLYKLASGLKESLNAFEVAQNSLKGLAGVARYNGVEIGEAMQAASAMTEDGLMNIAASSKSLQNLLSRGFKIDEALTMLGRLKDAAAFNRAGSLSMAEAVESATEGLKNENSILVDNAGVTKNVSVMWKEYADSIGRGVQSLTLAEKRQAEYNGILRETEAQAGNAARAADGMTGAKARLSTQVLTLKTALGESLVPAFKVVATVGGTVVQTIKAFIGGIEILSVRAASLWEKAKLWGDWVNRGFRDPVEAVRAKSAALEATANEQIDEIIAKWEGKAKAPDIGADSGKRRTDGNAGGPKKYTDKELKDAAKGADEFTDLWQAQAKDRYEVQSRGIDAIIEKEEAAKEKIVDDAAQMTDLWQAQAADRYEVQSRGLDAIIEKEAEAASGMVALSRRTAEAMEQNFSDFFFDAISGKLKSLSDYSNAVLQSIQRATSDYLGQMLSSGLFGKDGQGGGFVDQIGSAIGTWIASAKGNAFDSAGVVKFALGGVVTRPTLFPFAKGTGLMGEAGPEGILPLGRTPSGELGVKTTGGGRQPDDGGGVTLVYAPQISALDTRSGIEFLAGHSQVIVGILNKFYNDRGKRGPIR